jgi:RNA-directed DNA polymerase
LAFDVTNFFGNLDHKLLKARLRRIVGAAELPDDWYKVLRYITRFRFVELNDLMGHSVFGARIKSKKRDPIATVAELKAAGIAFKENPIAAAGIPQGTPISATLSNLYMIDFDVAARAYCDGIGALYRRYSDDILVVCYPADAPAMESEIIRLIKREKLELSAAKTERTTFDPTSPAALSGRAAQYLGYTLQQGGAAIRPSSLSRQWRKMRRAIGRTLKVAEAEMAAGRANKVYTKKLRRRFTALQFRNFSSYGRRSAAAFGGGEKIMKQLHRFEREAERMLAAVKATGRLPLAAPGNLGPGVTQAHGAVEDRPAGH